MMNNTFLYSAILSLLFIATTSADPIDDYDFNWLTISDVGNVAFEGDHIGRFAGYGSVDYQYRIAQTEVTTTQYFEFVNAYWPYYTDFHPLSSNFTGSFIGGNSGGGGYVYGMYEGWENAPIEISTRNAARYCNWLHNGKVNEEWAFLTGAYDATTFTKNQDGTYNDDYTRLEGAKYWIPSVSEWMKAVYYDPNKDGEGQGGWWDYTNGSDTPSVVGLPEDGGETNASLWDWYYDPLLPAGMYPDVQTPWGLLDASGGMSEITEDRPYGYGYAFGSNMFDFFPSAWDIVGGSRTDNFPDWTIDRGLRLATNVPAPSVLMVLFIFFGCTLKRRL